MPHFTDHARIHRDHPGGACPACGSGTTRVPPPATEPYRVSVTLHRLPSGEFEIRQHWSDGVIGPQRVASLLEAARLAGRYPEFDAARELLPFLVEELQTIKELFAVAITSPPATPPQGKG